MTGKKKNMLGPMIAIMSMFVFVPDTYIISSILSKISQSYPDVSTASVTYLLTAVNIAQIVAAFFTGAVLGRKMSYKSLSLIAIAFYTVFGGLPLFFDMSFGLLLLSRILFGLGIGCWMPICQSYISAMYEDEKKRASVLGFGMSLFSVGMICGTMVASIMGSVNWHITFGFYLLGTISFILVAILMKEPERASEQKNEKVRIPKQAISIVVFYAFMQLILGIYSGYISFIVTQAGGSVVMAGTIMTIFSVACIFGALGFGLVYRLIKQYVLVLISILILVSFIAFSLGGLSAAIWVILIGAIICGLGLNLCSTAVPMLLSITVPSASVAAAMAASAIFCNLGGFLSSPLLQVIEAVNGKAAPAYFAFYWGTALSVVLLIVSIPLSIKLRKAAKSKELEAPARA